MNEVTRSDPASLKRPNEEDHGTAQRLRLEKPSPYGPSIGLSKKTSDMVLPYAKAVSVTSKPDLVKELEKECNVIIAIEEGILINTRGCLDLCRLESNHYRNGS